MRKKNIVLSLAAAVAVLALLSGAALSGSLPAMKDHTPAAALTLGGSDGLPAQEEAPGSPGEDPAGQSAQAPAATSGPASTQAPATTRAPTETPAETTAAYHPGAQFRDDLRVWRGQSTAEIFRISYDNEAGATTVTSAYGDKIIAPGTQDSYIFYVENTGDCSIDYTVTAEGSASFLREGVEYEIPIEVRLSHGNGQYILGSENGWVGIQALNNLSSHGTVARGNRVKYTLDWRWLFEQPGGDGDSYDTWLGDLAAEGQELTVRVKLMAYATASADPNAPGGIPKTGDNARPALWGALGLLSLAACLALVIFVRRGGKDET